MPGKHSEPTVAFRPTSWQKALIEERAKASGMFKKDFIARSCIYSNIVVVGKRERIQRLVDEVQEMQITMKEIAGQIQSGNFSLSDDSYRELKEDYLTFAITMVDILNGAAYLFEKKPECDSRHWKEELELEEYMEALRRRDSGEMGIELCDKYEKD